MNDGDGGVGAVAGGKQEEPCAFFSGIMNSGVYVPFRCDWGVQRRNALDGAKASMELMIPASLMIEPTGK
jgi:hypothetical protein